MHNKTTLTSELSSENNHPLKDGGESLIPKSGHWYESYLGGPGCVTKPEFDATIFELTLAYEAHYNILLQEYLFLFNTGENPERQVIAHAFTRLQVLDDALGNKLGDYLRENVHEQLKHEVEEESWNAFDAWRHGNGPPAYEEPEPSHDSLQTPNF